MKVEFLTRNLGNDLIRKIYAKGYKLEATEVIVKSGKYARYAVVDMFEDNDCIVENYCISI